MQHQDTSSGDGDEEIEEDDQDSEDADEDNEDVDEDNGEEDEHSWEDGGGERDSIHCVLMLLLFSFASSRASGVL